MALEEYKKKRKFEKTPEPKGKVEKDKGTVFVVQEHDARNLHWDFRLEDQGVLKSWAVPKKPPTTAGTKRLAIQTEDHPVDYAKFEGVIPAGLYGAGSVKVWDHGKFKLIEKTENKYEIELKGKRLKGKYHLVRFKKAGEKAWLFFKSKE
jgi:DNA ligase D-like protein (predicted 3'-phosphoesterase)